MQENYYTHALWHVKEGKAEEFLVAWKKFAHSLSQVPNSPSVRGTLIQSITDPLVFYSFGPWETLEDIHTMRNNEKVKLAFTEIVELCQDTKPAHYKTVMQLTFPSSRKQ
ncbi:antibiotic biosynthesis monooxygenase family protein [Rufibacter hautae]|uniref:ABM domain-containing protein n=1 Tax=Rufibacter hautae TaxID=2595005 RepID=A0A5B6TDJ8_9BACT|nr:antibiotic biosynthesis monooxygenase [Rufibacter hautae]KAA3438236.1 hypothetical protein FOA19_13320 [Rufibacter hautae]